MEEKLNEAEEELGEMEPDTEEFYDLIDLMGAGRAISCMNQRNECGLTEFSGMGFSAKEDMERPVEEFSGGWQMRIALGNFFTGTSLLILDEPTNHLDVVAQNWLEHYLKKYQELY